MITWMTHELHGKHPAVGTEIEEMKKNGWVVYEKPVKIITVDTPKEILAEEVQIVKKRGRPHKG